jgi:hypothetical protein
MAEPWPRGLRGTAARSLPPRGSRYFDALAELALFAACSAAAYVVEALVAGVSLRRAAESVRSWLAGEPRDGSTLQAWSAAAALPVARLRRPSPHAIGAGGAGAAATFVATSAWPFASIASTPLDASNATARHKRI